MSFPDDPLDIEVSLAYGADISLAPASWTYTPITSDDPETTMVRSAVVIRRGRADEQAQAEPTQISYVVRDPDDDFSPRNVSGPNYGQLLRNTPTRVRVNPGTGYEDRATAHVTTWEPRWDGPEINDRKTINALGVLSRLGEGSDPLRSAMFRAVSRLPTMVHYWPMEDPDGSTEFSAATEGTPSLLFLSGTPDLASVDPGTTANLPDLSSGVKVGRSGITGGSSSQWGLSHSVKSIPSGADFISLGAEIAGGTYNRVHFLLDNLPKVDVVATTPGGSATTVATSATNVLDGEFHSIGVDAAQNGASITWSLFIDLSLVATATVAGTLGRLAGVTANQDASIQCKSIGHIATHLIIAGAGQLNQFALEGYVGDTPEERFERLCQQEGIAADGQSAGSAVTMGPQRPAALMDLLRECEAASEGVMVERVDGRLGLDAHAVRENVAVTLALDYEDCIVAPFEPTDDTQLIRNWVTATDPDNTASAHVEQVTGTVGMTAIGTYPDEPVRNLQNNADLVNHAGWRLALGTVDQQRFPTIRLELHNHPTLITAWLACDIGSRITLENAPAGKVGPDLIDLVLEGYTELLDVNEWIVDLNCAPYAPYAIGELSDTSGDTSEFADRLAEDEAAALRTAIDSDDTSIVFDPNRYRWVTHLVSDAFGRTSSSSWGSADSGQAWTNTGGSASDFSVGSGAGKHSVGTLGVARRSAITTGALDVDITIQFSVPALITGAGFAYIILAARSVDTDNEYEFDLRHDSTPATIDFKISRRVGGVQTNLTAVSATIVHVAGNQYAVRIQIMGAVIRMKWWNATTDTEPAAWGHSVVDTAPLTAGTAFRIWTQLDAGITTALPLVISFDNLVINGSGPSAVPDDFPLDVRLVNVPGIAGGGEVVTATSGYTVAAQYVAAGALAHADNAAVAPALYTGHAAGDWICVLVRIRAASAGTLDTPTGYTRLEIGGFTSISEMQLYAKVHDGSEVAPTITPSGGAAGDTVSAVTFGLRNMPTTLADLNDAVVASYGYTNASAQDIIFPGISPGLEGCVVLALGGKDDDWTSVATLTGFTEAVDGSTTTGNDQGLVVDYAIQTNPPAVVSNSSFVVTGGASAVSNGALVAIAGGYQVLTVTRGTNGVTKSHAIGTLLEVADPLVLGL